MKKRIAITMGEPGGVGPEVAVRAAAMAQDLCEPVLVGAAGVWEDALRRYAPGLRPEIADTGACAGYEPGRPTAEGGAASAVAIGRAVGMALAGEVSAMVTAPISKEALKMAGHGWPGHTEMLAELTGTREYGMMLMGGGLRVMLLSIHVSMREALGLVTRANVERAVGLARRACSMLGIGAPRIAVAGLNPHAGEAGMFGSEEIEAIAPAIAELRARGVPVTGPYPPDTLYLRAARGEFDIVVSMYHDQGLIPIKLLAFDTGVNVTIGLPIVRTSPDHGTAYDRAWRGVASPNSMLEAVRAACTLRTDL